MKLLIAFKAFFKALRCPQEAEKFLSDQKKDKQDVSHLQLLASFQESGRLVDFLKEDISSYSDSQIGAAVREVHQKSAKTLEELVTVRPIFEEKEGQEVRIESGYNPLEVKLIGKIKGEPPFTGKLVHKGWKAHKKSLPKVNVTNENVIHPAEIEIR